MTFRIPLTRALKVAAIQLPFAKPKDIAKRLDDRAHTLVEAYRIGAEEAQAEIVRRLAALEPAIAAKVSTG